MLPIFQTILLLLLFESYLPAAVVEGKYEYSCNPLVAKRFCLMGCLACYETFGRNVYNLAHCCYDCKVTGAYVIDYGPSNCSRKYLFDEYKKRKPMSYI